MSYSALHFSNFADHDAFWFLIVVIAALFSVITSAKVKNTFEKYSRQRPKNGMTGSDAARIVLDSEGLKNVSIKSIKGELTDHYDPRDKTLYLSEKTFEGASTAAIGVACHEAGHAIQDAENYGPLVFRNAIVKMTNIGSKIAMPLFIIGIVLTAFSNFFIFVAYIGIACFMICVVFQLVTLPTEFNASRRALNAIAANGILEPDETEGAKKVLTAAAMTYVAALAVALSQLLRLISVMGRRR